jgi:AcrR family transcriptional regulator
VILEATAQLIEGEGEASTNRIAERAGVSIGTLYQYFPNREAILHLLAEKEQARILKRLEDGLASADPDKPEAAIRAALHVLLNAFNNRHRLRRHLILTLMPKAPHLLAGVRADEIFGRVMERFSTIYPGQFRPMGETARFVLMRSVMGVIRSAIVEKRSLHDPALENELTHFLLVYMAA